MYKFFFLNIAFLFVSFFFLFQNCFSFLSMWICLFLWYIAFSFLWIFSFLSWVLDHDFHRLHCKFWSKYPIIYYASTELGTLVSFPIHIFWDTVPVHELWQVPLLPSARLGILDTLLLSVILDLCTWNCLWDIWNYLWGGSWAICKRVLHTSFFFWLRYPSLNLSKLGLCSI